MIELYNGKTIISICRCHKELWQFEYRSNMIFFWYRPYIIKSPFNLPQLYIHFLEVLIHVFQMTPLLRWQLEATSCCCILKMVKNTKNASFCDLQWPCGNNLPHISHPLYKAQPSYILNIKIIWLQVFGTNSCGALQFLCLKKLLNFSCLAVIFGKP